MPNDVLSILLVDDNSERAQAISESLNDSRYRIAHMVSSGNALLRHVERLRPDIIVIDIESPDRDILDSLQILSNTSPKPIVMFSEQEDTDTIKRSVSCGVSAYVAGDTDPKRVRAILDAALARFEAFQSIKQELDNTRSELEARKVIDQAKRALMKQKSLTEDQAFHSMRKMAMDSGQKLDDVARTVLSFMNHLG